MNQERICNNCKTKIKQENILLCNHCGGIPDPIEIFGLMEEMKRNTVKLNTKINQLREFVRSLKLYKDDERGNMLQGLSYLFGWLNWQLIFYHNFAKTGGVIPNTIKKQNLKMPDSKIEEIVANFDIINRRVFFVDFMFRVEHLMRRINGILHNPTKRKRYVEVIEHILKELEISKTRDEHYNTLVFPAYVRNTLHLNEIIGNDGNGKIRNVFFEMKKGEETQYTSWRHLYFFCDSILDEVQIILSVDLIKNKPIITRGPIKQFWKLLKPGKSMRLPKNFPIFDEKGRPI